MIAANAVLLVILVWQVGERFVYEASGAFNGDSPIYWAVGRGLVNGLALYKDLFDIKPPGIFLLSAFSYATTGTMALGHFLQGIFIALLPFTMLLPFAVVRKEFEPQRRLFGWLLWLALAGGLTLYVAKEGGEFQTESFGVLFICAYIGLASLMRRNSHWIWMTLAGVLIFGGIFFKEPFILAAVAGALLLCNSVRDVVRIIIIPCLIAGILFAITLLLMGALDDYFTVYLPFMTSARTQRFGSPISRAFLLEMIWTQMWRFSAALTLAIGCMWLWSFVRSFRIDVRSSRDLGWGALFLAGLTMFIYGAQTERVFFWQTGKWFTDQSPGWLSVGLIAFGYAWYQLLRQRADRGAAIFKTVTLLFALGCVGFLGGLSGEFLGHHMLFAIPIYVALGFTVIEDILHSEKPFSPLPLVIAALLVSAVFFHHRMAYAERRAQWTAEAAQTQALADILDSVLTSCNISQYLIIGEPGTNIFGYTHHSPVGPIFFQHTLIGTFPPFTLSYVSQLMNAQVIFRKVGESRAHNMQGVDEYLAYTFSDETPLCAGPAFQQPEGYRLLFRKLSVPVTLDVNDEGDAGITFEQVPAPPEETVPSVYDIR